MQEIEASGHPERFLVEAAARSAARPEEIAEISDRLLLREGADEFIERHREEVAAS